MNLSSLGFLFFPLLGILIPMILWISKKDKVKNVNETGKAILNFQITWIMLAVITFIILGMLFVIFLYVYNIILILVNSIFAYKGLRMKYFPKIRFLR